MSQFEFGVGLFPTEPLQKMIHLAKVSEEVGFSHIWVGDSHLIWREAYVNMTAMMLNTSESETRHRRDQSTDAPSVGACQRLRDVRRIFARPDDRRHRLGRQLGGNHGHEAVDAGEL